MRISTWLIALAGLLVASSALAQGLEHGPAWSVLSAGACPEGTAVYPGDMLHGIDLAMSNPGSYSHRDWLCDALGDRFVRIANGGALGGRTHGCAKVAQAPPQAQKTLCLLLGDGRSNPLPMVVSPPVAVGPVKVVVARGDYVCPGGTVPMGVDVAQALAGAGPALCNTIGDSPVRLVPRGVMGGPRFGCQITDDLPAALTATLCVQINPEMPQLFPDADGIPAVQEYRAEKLDGTPLARVFFSFDQTPGSWKPNRMYWDAPVSGAPSWSPDGKTSFRLVPVKTHTTSDLPALTAIRKSFGNRGRKAEWTMETWPVVPQYRIAEIKDAGLSRMADGTLRFYRVGKATGTLFDRADATATFIANDAAPKLVLADARSVDDPPQTD